MISYKKIVKNMVDSEIHSYVEKHAGDYVPYPENVSVEIDKENGDVIFKAEIRVKNNPYTINGYVSEHGLVNVCSVSFERDYVIDDNRPDWWARDNIRHKSECIWGDGLKEFKFDC